MVIADFQMCRFLLGVVVVDSFVAKLSFDKSFALNKEPTGFAG